MPIAPSYERIFGTLTAYQTSAALAAAIELDLFTHIGAGATSLAALARASGASERGLRALCNHLAAFGFLTKEGEVYRPAADAAVFLDRRSPQFMGSVAGFLNSPGLVRDFENLAGAVKRGGTIVADGGTVASENPVWVDFARAMAPMARLTAAGLADALCAGGVPRRVLDVAAGHGAYGIELAQRSSAGEVTFLDWKNVLAVARENVRAAGLEKRARYLEGSAFELEFGDGYDAVLFPNFLHHFEREANVRLLAKARKALAKGGRVAVLEFLVNDDRVTPPPSAAFDLVMLATTPRGQAYPASEYEQMFRTAGLAKPAGHLLPPGMQFVMIAGPS